MMLPPSWQSGHRVLSLPDQGSSYPDCSVCLGNQL
uniref:Uncharacterized protein n=1 Tax=Anguilla anguilla TaxID=7936 RepID=A0A0E9XXH0_ANGAN